MKKTWFIASLCVVLALPAFPVWGQTAPSGKGNIKLGPLEVHPSVGLSETFTDNVYRNFDGKDKKNDWITDISPGLELVLPLRRHSIKVGYLADIYRYAKNSENSYTQQMATGSLNLDFPGGLLLTVSDTYLISEIARKWVEQPGLNGVNDPYRALPYRSNDFQTRAKYSFADRWAAAAWYSYYKYDYENEYDRAGSYDRNLFGGSVFYRLTPKTDFLVEYSHSKVDYPKSLTYDNDNDTGYIGLSFDPTAKVNGYLKVGWTQKKYDVSSPGMDNKFNAFSTQIDLAYKLSDFDVLTLRGSRTIEEDVDTNAAFTRDTYTLGYSHTLSRNEKIRFNALVGYGKSSFERPQFDSDGTFKTRNEDIYSGTIGVDYAMLRWLLWNLSYTYEDRNSNFVRYNSAENRVFLKATVSF